MSPKTVKYICPICNKESITTKWRFDRKKTPFCKNCVTTGTQTGIKKPQISGENSGRWGGGRYISSDGYEMVKCENEFHSSGRQKYKKAHILIVEESLGRELNTQRGYMGEQIHHVDGDKLNNSLDNLVLCKDTREHRNLHCQLEKISLELVREGVIVFDHTKKEYKINESRIT